MQTFHHREKKKVSKHYMVLLVKEKELILICYDLLIFVLSVCSAAFFRRLVWLVYMGRVLHRRDC